MDNNKVKEFIISQRENNVPDAEIQAFLIEKGALQGVTQPEQSDNNTGIKATGFVRGLGKSALSTIQGAGEFGQNILQQTAGRVVEKITGTPKEELGARAFDEGTEQSDRIKEIATPDNTGESVGKFTGDVAQFFIPATRVAKLQKGSSLVAKIAGQSISDTGVQLLKEGEVNNDVRDTAILSTLIPTGFAGGSAGIKKLLGKSGGASKVINSLIKPASREFSYGKNPGLAVAEEGIIASSLDDLATKIDETLTLKSGEYINTVKQSGAIVDVSKSFSPIDEAIETAVKQNNQGLVNRLNDIKVALTNNLSSQADEAGNEIIKSTGVKQLDNLSAEDLVTLKREIGDMTSFTGNASDDKLVNKALKSIYGNIKTSIDEAVPGSSDLSERIASLISAKTATVNRVGIMARQNIGGFTGKVLTGAGTLASIFTANPLPALIGLGAQGIESGLSTPAFKTRLAKFLIEASQSEKDELFKALPGVRAIINREIGND